jgi:hypothetical protein
MFNYLEFIGIAIQTFAGLVFLLQQSSELDEKHIFKNIGKKFSDLLEWLRVAPAPLASMIATALLVILGIVMWLRLGTPTTINSHTPLIVYLVGGLNLLTFILGMWVVPLGWTLNILLPRKQRLVLKPHFRTWSKFDLRNRTENKDVWDVNSEQLKKSFTRANQIICVSSLAVGFYGFCAFSRAISSGQPFIVQTFGLLVGMISFLFVLTFIVSGICLIILGLLCIARWLLPIKWQFLALIWLLGGLLLLINAGMH